MAITHYPPADAIGAERLRNATVAWAPLLGELQAVGLRPYLELERGGHDDPLRLFCDLDDGLLLDVALDDAELPDTPDVSSEVYVYWTAIVQSDGSYLAEITIDLETEFDELAGKLRELVDAVAAGQRPFMEDW